MKNNPLVTVNILSYNRREALRNTLQKVYEQDCKNIEVIVVDNASSDGSSEMVSKDFPNVILIKMQKNIGIAGWNEGFNSSNGKYILLLDDDAYPAPNSILRALDLLENRKTAGCVTFNLIDNNSVNTKRTKWLPDEEIEACEWPVFVGCAVLIKKECELKMPLDYFLYQHELPMSACIYYKGYKILYNKNIIAFHFFKDESVYNPLQDKYCFKNNMSFIINFLPKALVLFYYLQQVLFYLTRSIKNGWFSEWVTISLNTNRNDNSFRINYKYFFSLRKLHLFNFRLISKIIK